MSARGEPFGKLRVSGSRLGLVYADLREPVHAQVQSCDVSVERAPSRHQIKPVGPLLLNFFTRTNPLAFTRSSPQLTGIPHSFTRGFSLFRHNGGNAVLAMPGKEYTQEDIELLTLASLQSGSFDGKPEALRGKAVRLAVLLYRSDSVNMSR